MRSYSVLVFNLQGRGRAAKRSLVSPPVAQPLSFADSTAEAVEAALGSAYPRSKPQAIFQQVVLLFNSEISLSFLDPDKPTTFRGPVKRGCWGTLLLKDYLYPPSV